MADSDLLTAAKLAGRITTDVYDSQIESLLDASLLDMGVAGVTLLPPLDKLVQQASITYFLMHFGQPDQYDRLKKSYDEQKAQLSMCSDYTLWEGQTEDTAFLTVEEETQDNYLTVDGDDNG